ncbi:MAG: tetratricopeptide repeat protein [Phycisphaerales bacterium]|nr:tetratricopeptide repeat protein [Phycisphaerales bacterium]
MDERIKGIKEGAGREESRINEDLLEFLQKWSTPALMVLAGIAVAYWGWNKYKQMQVAKVNQATSAYTSATVGGPANPDTLGNIAREYANVRSFGLLAKLDLADVYLLAVQRGLAPGVEYTPGAELAPGDVLDESGRAMYLERAGKLYREVFDATGSASGKEPLAIEALFGMAAVAETSGDFEGARTHLRKAKELCEKVNYEAAAIVAEKRMNAVGTGAAATLFAADALPPLPEPEPILPPETQTPTGVEALPDTGEVGPQDGDEPAPASQNPPADDGGASGGESSEPSEGGGGGGGR